MRVRHYGFIVIAIIALALMAGCGKETPSDGDLYDPDRAEQLVAEANQAVEDGDWAKADSLYKEALKYDPDNTDANFGVGFCQIVLLRDDPDIEEIISLVESWLSGEKPVPPKAFDLWGRRVGKGKFSYEIPSAASFPKAIPSFMKFVIDTIPALSDIQQIIDDRIIPVINYVLGKFEFLEGYPDFYFYITPGMGEGVDTNIVIDSIEIDVGDIYVADAGLRTIRGILRILTAYNFDVNYDSLLNEATRPTYVRTLIDGNNSFFTLKGDGATKMSDSRGDLLTAIEKVRSGVNSIQDETDPQDDDLIPKMSQDEYEDFMLGLDTATAVLTVPYTVAVYDTAGIEMEIIIDAKKFFLNPIVDWKAKLPYHHWDWDEGGFVPDSPLTFPDPTFNGIFPDMTNPDWRRLIGNP